MDDLAALAALLPDNVKRKIVSAAAADGASAVAATPRSPRGAAPSAGAAVPPGAAATAIARRRLVLPLLGDARACVLDGALSEGEAQARARRAPLLAAGGAPAPLRRTRLRRRRRRRAPQAVAAAAEAWLAARGRRPGMGAAAAGGRWADAAARGDVASWASADELAAGGAPLLAAAVAMLDGLRSQLQQQGYDVGGRVSVQVACYPGGGARYVRHADASAAVPGRSVTALLYLNLGWDPQRDGGALALYNAAHATHGDSGGGGEPLGHLRGEPATLVAPLAGRVLVFEAGLQHEVLPAHRHRYSITAFFYAAGGAGSGGGAGAAGEGGEGGERGGAALPLAAAPPLPAPRAPPPGGPAAPRIFVSVASFRDPETQWTLRDLFRQAARPERVTVGVVWQVDPDADAHLTRVAGGASTAPFRHQVREARLHWRAAAGPVAARALAAALWGGEEFVLQVDAHMRFARHWDELCLQQLAAAQAAAGSARVSLSTYPPGYSGDGAAAAAPEDAPATLLCASGFDGDGLLRIRARTLRRRPAGPVPSLFWAAGFSFASSAWLAEVPYCPHLPHLFFGEESYMLARMATRGWRVAAPALPLAFHQWERSARAASYQGSGCVDAAARAASQARVLQVLRGEAAGGAGGGAPEPAPAPAAAPPCEADWAPGGVWGLGTAVSLAEFEAACGVSWAARRVSERARHGGLDPGAFEPAGEELGELGGGAGRLHSISGDSLADLAVALSPVQWVEAAVLKAWELAGLALRLWTYLRFGWLWLAQAARLALYALFLLPGFLQMIHYYATSPRVTRGVAYGRKPRQALDLYLPKTAGAGGAALPVVVFVTGGAWTIGYRAWGALLGRRLCDAGVITACLDYRNFPQGSALDMLEDVNTGIAWVLRKIERRGGDPERVWLVGQSAGGQLAMRALLSQAAQAATGAAVLGGAPLWHPAALAGFVGVSGAYDLEGLAAHLHARGLYKELLDTIMSVDGRVAYELLSPLHAARAAPPGVAAFMPPVLLLHGTADKSVPASSSLLLSDALSAAGVASHVALLPGKTHTDLLLEDGLGGGRDVLTDTILACVTQREEVSDHPSMCPRGLVRLASAVCPF
ncbi:hypothetical protein HT031_000571 [Scenedesmus sp. PABB004]|nr:hypothetical protein HT031_000571 [Scenedesmus sp. PABB004]